MCSENMWKLKLNWILTAFLIFCVVYYFTILQEIKENEKTKEIKNIVDKYGFLEYNWEKEKENFEIIKWDDEKLTLHKKDCVKKFPWDCTINCILLDEKNISLLDKCLEQNFQHKTKELFLLDINKTKYLCAENGCEIILNSCILLCPNAIG